MNILLKKSSKIEFINKTLPKNKNATQQALFAALVSAFFLKNIFPTPRFLYYIIIRTNYPFNLNKVFRSHIIFLKKDDLLGIKSTFYMLKKQDVNVEKCHQSCGTASFPSVF